jgi:hypothetical protein
MRGIRVVTGPWRGTGRTNVGTIDDEDDVHGWLAGWDADEAAYRDIWVYVDVKLREARVEPHATHRGCMLCATRHALSGLRRHVWGPF